MKLKKLAHCIALIGIAGTAAAQQVDSGPMQRVEITGSSIKRVAQEGALPIQLITAEEIARAGITSTEQLVATLSANGTGADNMSSQQGFVGNVQNVHNNGAAGISLRGLGAGSTLVLLNGRRVSTHGLSGQAVDLNSIPLAAVQRVEVLTDGASAIYGTDAIGGVINFILKRNYEGLEASAAADVTQQKGGNIARASLIFGKGNLETDGYNFMTVLATDTFGKLTSADRDFANNGYQPARGLSPDTTGTPFGAQNARSGYAIGAAFRVPGDSTLYSRANLLAFQGKCDSIPKMTAYVTALWDAPQFGKACAYDYGADWTITQPVKHVNLVSRANIKFDKDTLGFVELVASRTKSQIGYTPLQVSDLTYPAGGAYYQDLSAYMPGVNPATGLKYFDNTKPIYFRWRCNDCGPRNEDTTSDAYRVLAGLEGSFGGKWDYKLGLSSSSSKGSTIMTDGYVYSDAFHKAMLTGIINPWLLPGQSQTPAAIALINSTKAPATPVYSGKTNLTELDGTVSGELFQLPAGALGAALGVDFRSDSYQFADDAAAGPIIQSPTAPPISKVTQNVSALFAELSVPIIKDLEAQLAVRHDHYSNFGGTTNPKVALRYQPSKQVLLRGSANSGFHAPDYLKLYSGTSTDVLNSAAADPELCPKHPGDPTYCGEKFTTKIGGNPGLQPEKSRQLSFGIVVSPADWIVASADFWRIKRSNVITVLSPNDVLANYAELKQYVIRNADGTINYIQGGYTNAAKDQTQGVDLSVAMNGKLAQGRWNATLQGSYTDSFKQQLLPISPMQELVGKFGVNDLYLRWKHNASFTYADGPWSTTLTQTFKSGYKDQVPAGTVPPGFNPDVASYTLYHLSASYKGIKNLTLTAGVKNLLNTAPPFSAHNVDDVAGAGWDSRVGDPRGRSVLFNVNYKFM
ncbi:MAG: TonB-dependent receptor [Pseudomonadota bacterium]